jgi:HK97 family phage major capsid protein
MDTTAKLKAKRTALMAAADAAKQRLDAQAIEDPDLILKFEQLKDDIKALDAEIRADTVQRAKRAVPVAYDPTNLPRRHPRRAMNLRSFKDTVDAHGVVVRADEQAFRFGKFLYGTIFNHGPSQDWCRERGIMTKAQVEGVNSSGGVLVPEEVVNTIVNLKEAFGVAAQYCQKVPMNRDSVHMPRRSGGLTAYFPQEGTAPTESTATFDDVQLQAKKIMALVRISSELAEDAIINIADWIASEIAYAFASKEDDCLFSGDGTSTYGGITGLKNAFVTNTAGVYTATGHTTYDAITVKDIALWRGYLPQYALPNAKFYCSQSFFSTVFRQLGGAGGGNTIQTLSGDLGYQWLGTPIVISQKLPTTSAASSSVSGTIVAYYGDMSKAVAFGDRRQITIKRSDERYFDSDQIGVSGTERFDIVAHDVGTTSVVGPLVALKMG